MILLLSPSLKLQTATRLGEVSPISIISQSGGDVNNGIVPESKKEMLWFTSTGIDKADGGSQVPNNSNAVPQPASETPLVSSSASKGIISQSGGNVNSNADKTAQKTHPINSETIMPLSRCAARMITM